MPLETNHNAENHRNCTVRLAELADPNAAQEVLKLLEHYAEHPLGNGGPLPASVRETVIEGLRKHPTTLIFLADLGSLVVGMAVCFVGFSTFKAKPLINIHDLVVHSDWRGRGIGSALIDAVVAHAQDRLWCAVTLEVRADNLARRLYAHKGFRDLSKPTHDQTMLFGKLLLPSSDERP